jgi:hypothetical protein
MSNLLLFVVIAAGPVETYDISQSAELRAAARPYHEISNDVYDAMRREAMAKTLPQRAPAIREMASLYYELLRDPRLATSDTLKQYKTKLWARLVRVKRELEIDIARSKKQTGQGRSSVTDDAAQLRVTAADQASQSLAAQLILVSYSLGGPAQVFAETGGAFGGGTGPADLGEELVALIERTISPDFWEVSGGPGSIVYYYPLKVLVVRATTEVHENIGGVLGGLRDAGR